MRTVILGQGRNESTDLRLQLLCNRAFTKGCIYGERVTKKTSTQLLLHALEQQRAAGNTFRLNDLG